MSRSPVRRTYTDPIGTAGYRFHASDRAHTYLGPIDHPEAVGQGEGIGPDQRYPDFMTIAAGFVIIHRS